jgi:hypothetical protein
MTDLETWFHDDGEDALFNVYVKKHIYTPYEQEQKFSDESTEQLELQNVHMVKVVELPDGDVLLGFQWFSEDEDEPTQSYIYYYKLSEIRLVEVYPCGE